MPEDRERRTSFVKMLHSLSRDSGKEQDQRIKGSSQYRNVKASGRKERSNLIGKQPDEAIIATTAQVSDSQPPAIKKQHSCTELCRWTAKSQQGYETGVDAPEEDYVQLLLMENGELMLRYKVTGEDTFETGVDSPEEAESLILEDNMTTARLYPGNPEFQWLKK